MGFVVWWWQTVSAAQCAGCLQHSCWEDHVLFCLTLSCVREKAPFLMFDSAGGWMLLPLLPKSPSEKHVACHFCSGCCCVSNHAHFGTDKHSHERKANFGIVVSGVHARKRGNCGEWPTKRTMLKHLTKLAHGLLQLC